MTDIRLIGLSQVRAGREHVTMHRIAPGFSTPPDILSRVDLDLFGLAATLGNC